jgi:hypothetical protein
MVFRGVDLVEQRDREVGISRPTLALVSPPRRARAAPVKKTSGCAPAS